MVCQDDSFQHLCFVTLASAPQVYSVIGAASAVGGLTRMTISLVVIIFELTGAVELVLQIMMAVMISKFTADYFSVDGIYEGELT